MKENQGFEAAAEDTARMIDFVVASLGSDMDILQMQLKEMASSQEKLHRVRPEHWSVMSRALLLALESSLKERFDDDCKMGWAAVFDSVADMLKCSIKQYDV
jgi:hemoglobin-like flavoprotein